MQTVAVDEDLERLVSGIVERVVRKYMSQIWLAMLKSEKIHGEEKGSVRSVEVHGDEQYDDDYKKYEGVGSMLKYVEKSDGDGFRLVIMNFND